MHRLLPLILIAALFITPLPPAAAHGGEAPSPAPERSASRRGAALIIGGTVAAVTGMWITLYKRGKK